MPTRPTRPARARRVPVVLAIGGFDPSAGAGLAADQRAIQAQGAHSLMVVTATTAQGLLKALAAHPVRAAVVRDQIAALEAEFRFDAIKLGMLATHGTVAEVLRLLDRHPGVPVVCDPVLATTSGLRLLTERGFRLLQNELLPRLRLLTPNLPELLELGGRRDRTKAIDAILETGVEALLLKGGHDPRGKDVVDRFVSRAPRRHRDFVHPRLSIDARGTGCTLASAIAARIAFGESLSTAVSHGERYLQKQLRAAIEPTATRKSVLPGLMRPRSAK